MDIEKLAEEIINGIDPSWDTLTKIRYVYIEVGKRVVRDTDFFFSVDEKLGDKNLTVDEIVQIYDSEYGRGNKVICKSASNILKKVYDKLGIESKLIRYNNSVHWQNGKDILTIYHWFLAVKDGDKTYFLTLNSDLPNIQMGLKTEHFANMIRHTRIINGERVQIYEGEPITESIVDEKRLAEIDRKIGYIKNYYRVDSKSRKSNDFKQDYDDAGLVMLKNEIRGNKLYYDLITYESDFYSYFQRIRLENGEKKSLFDEKVANISDEMWLKWKKKICKAVLEKLEKMLGIELNVIPYLDSKDWNYDIWLMRLCVLCEDRILSYFNYNNAVDTKDLRVDVQNFKFNKWSGKIKTAFGYRNNPYDYNNVLLIIEKLNAIINAVDRKDIKSFNKLYSLLAFHFIPSNTIYENNIDGEGYLSNLYIAKKFQKIFVNTFSCNSIRTNFNDMNYSEQVVIIKRVLEILFPEINYENSFNYDNYNDSYSAVMNRIQIYPVKSIENDNYCIIFSILGKKEDDDYYFFYDLKENTFRVMDVLEVLDNYVVISDRMKDKFNINNIESLGIAK